MSIAVYSGPASEPISIAEVMTHCALDATNQEPAPGLCAAALVSPAAAGNLSAGAYRYRLTFTTAAGQTQAGAISAPVTVVNASINGKIVLTALPVGGTLVTGRKIYRTAAGGAVFYLLTTIADNTTVTYTDNIADASLGAEAPSINTTDDPRLSILITAARQHAEQELGRYLVTQTLDAYFDDFPRYDNPRFPSREIRLPPLQSVASVKYIDTDGVLQTLAADQYTVDANAKPARIYPAYGLAWPDTLDIENAVTIRFVAGYGTAAAVPACIKHWLLMRVRMMYDNPAPFIVGPTGAAQLPPAFIDSLLDPERLGARC